jgi:hypothetical protein
MGAGVLVFVDLLPLGLTGRMTEVLPVLIRDDRKTGRHSSYVSSHSLRSLRTLNFEPSQPLMMWPLAPTGNWMPSLDAHQAIGFMAKGCHHCY